MSWQIYSKACADVLGFGTARLSRLKDESWKNYQQFNEWYREDGIDVAMERMRRCAEQALQEEIGITDVDETADTVEREFRKQQTQRIQAKRAAEVAHARAIREHTVMLNGKNVMERCNAHLQEIMCGNGLRK
jgi:coproporphyrinogen III oxidase-like Fe-S oxidoreductase